MAFAAEAGMNGFDKAELTPRYRTRMQLRGALVLRPNPNNHVMKCKTRPAGMGTALLVETTRREHLLERQRDVGFRSSIQLDHSAA